MWRKKYFKHFLSAYGRPANININRGDFFNRGDLKIKNFKIFKFFFSQPNSTICSDRTLDMFLNFSLTPDNFHKSITPTLLSWTRVGFKKLKTMYIFCSYTLKSAILAVFDSQKPYQHSSTYAGLTNGFWRC